MDVYFSIRSDTLTPDFITNYLGMEPSSLCVKGDVKRKGQTPFLENVWTIKINCSESSDMEIQVQTLINLLFESRIKLKTISHQCSYDVECILNLDSMQTIPVIHYNKNAVRFFADIGAELGVEIYA